MQLIETIKKRKYEAIILFSILIYTIIFSYYTNLKHYAFLSYAWDLGIFNQLFYSSIFGGKWFYCTPELFLNREGNFFAIHFSPILILLFPIYALFPKVQTLLSMKSFILSLAALPLFYISRKMIGNEKISLMISLAYLLNPGTQGANWFDFHPQLFIPLLTFTMFLMLIKENWIYYFITLLLELSIQEHVFTIVVVLIISSLTYFNRSEFLATIKKKKLNKYSVTILTIFICLLYYYASNNYRQSFVIEPLFIERYKATSAFSAMEFRGNTLLVPFFAVSHLYKTFKALTFDIYRKFSYMVFLLAPLLFLPIMNRFIILNLILFMPFLLSNYKAYYMIGSQYSLYLLPSIFISVIHTYKTEANRKNVNLAKYMLVVSFLMIVLSSPISPLSTLLNENGKILWYPPYIQITGRTQNIHEIIDFIPRDASILTQNHIFPHVSGRMNAYVLPPADFTPDQNEVLRTYINSMIDECEYVLLDLKLYDSWTSYANRKLTSEAVFGIHTFSDRIVLFRRGPAENQPSTKDADYRVYTAHTNMNLGRGSIIEEPGDEGRRVALCTAESGRGIFLYGPYTVLRDGVYDLTLHVKAMNHGEGYLGTLEVTSSDGIELLTKRDLYGYEFPDDEWRRFAVRLSLAWPKEQVEFRLYTAGAADILVDRIEVNRTEGDPGTVSSTRTFNFVDLPAKNAAITPDGLLHHRPEDDKEIFWFGPYQILPKGRYNVTYYLKAVPKSPQAGDAVILLDVCHLEGMKVLTSYTVRYDDLEHGTLMDGWAAIEIEVTIDFPEAVVEFRGRELSGEYDVYLGHILLEFLGT